MSEDEQRPTENLDVSTGTQTGTQAGTKTRFRADFLKRFTVNDPTEMLEWVQGRIQQRGFGFYGKLVTIILCAWFLSDVISVLIRSFVPEPRGTHGTLGTGYSNKRPKSEFDYQIVFTRNLFNSNGVIPGEGTGATPTGNAVRTSLPFNLVGTVILTNAVQSIATIEDRSAQSVYPVRVDDEIPGKAKITKIEAKRVEFINTSTNRLEYVDLPEEPEGNAPRIAVTGGGNTNPGIEQLSATQYNVSRTEVDRALADLNNVLTQARAVPNFENGQPAGYKLFQIIPGSIYAKLGLHDGDVINSLNGEPINDPGKAFAMLSALKEMNHLELGVKRDGRQSAFAYDIH